MASHFRFTPILLVVVVLAALVAWLYVPQGEEQKRRQMQASPVKVVLASEQPFEVTVEALGTAVANEAVIITAQSTDVVAQVHFNDGQLVEAGQLLVSLNSREEQARVKELGINLDEANRQLSRIRNLARENVASAQLLDEQQARVDALQAQLEVAKTRLAELEIHAPFAGQLGIRRVSPGALVTPGTQITTLDDLHQVKVDFSVAELHLASLKAGQQVFATSAAWPGETFVGTIASIDSRIDPVSRAVQVRAIIDNPDLRLRPGMLLRILIQKQVVNSLVIPESAIVPIQDNHFVYIVTPENKAHRQQVTIGLRKPGLVQISQGLKGGEKVVVEGALRLGEDSQVRILEN